MQEEKEKGVATRAKDAKKKLSQSLVKGYKSNNCKYLFKKIYIDKEVEIPTEAKNKGRYFEYLCLGESGRGDDVKDLPRLKNGEKSIDQIRIERLAAEFSKDWLGYVPDYVQLTLENDLGKGIIDFLARRKEDNALYHVDLKLSKGDYFYSLAEYDFIQQVFYQILVEDNFPKEEEIVPIMIIADYSSNGMSIIHRRLDILDESKWAVRRLFLETEKALDEEYESETPFQKTYSNQCEKCPLKDTCDTYLSSKDSISYIYEEFSV